MRNPRPRIVSPQVSERRKTKARSASPKSSSRETITEKKVYRLQEGEIEHLAASSEDSSSSPDKGRVTYSDERTLNQGQVDTSQQAIEDNAENPCENSFEREKAVKNFLKSSQFRDKLHTGISSRYAIVIFISKESFTLEIERFFSGCKDLV